MSKSCLYCDGIGWIGYSKCPMCLGVGGEPMSFTKFSEVSEQIEKAEKLLEVGVTNGADTIEELLPNMKLMLKTLETIRDMAKWAEDPEVIEDIAQLLGVTNKA